MSSDYCYDDSLVIRAEQTAKDTDAKLTMYLNKLNEESEKRKAEVEKEGVKTVSAFQSEKAPSIEQKYLDQILSHSIQFLSTPFGISAKRMYPDASAYFLNHLESNEYTVCYRSPNGNVELASVQVVQSELKDEPQECKTQGVSNCLFWWINKEDTNEVIYTLLKCNTPVLSEKSELYYNRYKKFMASVK